MKIRSFQVTAPATPLRAVMIHIEEGAPVRSELPVVGVLTELCRTGSDEFADDECQHDVLVIANRQVRTVREVEEEIEAVVVLGGAESEPGYWDTWFASAEEALRRRAAVPAKR